MKSSMKKVLLLMLVLSVPVFLFLETWQAFRFRKMQEEITALTQTQQEWLEKNKKVLANISLFRSPKRIEKLAKDELNLVRIEPERILRIELFEGEGQ